MGSISVQIFKSFAEISANTTSGFWAWKNAPQNSVFTFSAVPTGGDNPPNQFYGLQVTDVGYYQISGFENKREVRFRVKNPNAFKVTYEMHMSIASP